MTGRKSTFCRTCYPTRKLVVSQFESFGPLLTEGKVVPYTYGYSPRNKKAAPDVGEAPTAKEAFEQVQGLIHSDEVIRFIRTPSGLEIEVEELEYLAKQEGKI